MARRIKTNTLMAREGVTYLKGENGRYRKVRKGSGRFAGLSERGKAILEKREKKYRIQVETRFKDQHEKVLERMAENNVYSLKGAAYVVTQMAKARIVKAAKPSDPGESPHTKGKPKSLRASIIYDVDKETQSAVIGPSGGKVGTVGRLHEKGGVRGKAKYPARPFMAPALEEASERFIGQWKSSLVS
jgi:hypothetical protein